jgi:C4-dicarboxylate-specific signal transduction histidine kinase
MVHAVIEEASRAAGSCAVRPRGKVRAAIRSRQTVRSGMPRTSLLRKGELHHAELAHANRVALVGQLSAAIAHEVGQPITGIVTNAQVALRLLGAEPADLEETRQTLLRVVRDGKRAGEILERIRALVRKSPPRTELLSINDAIREALSLAQGQIAKHGVSVRTGLAEGLPLARGDWVQLQQVVLNLVVNAVEAMSMNGGHVRHLLVGTARATPDGAQVTVQDSGPGVDQADLERVFDAFYTTKREGLGMGLAICRSIIRAHGGRLWVTRSVPRGAVFQFTLPRGLVERSAAGGPIAAGPSADGQRGDFETGPRVVQGGPLHPERGVSAGRPGS